MNSDEKVALFQGEIKRIKTERVRSMASQLVGMLPDYFFKIAASSTNKYHPNYAQGDGGLYRHTQAAFWIGVELLNLDWWRMTQEERDLCLCSILVHDGWKRGGDESVHTKFNHPIVAAQKIMEPENLSFATAEDLQFVADCVATHMGQWTVDTYGSGAEELEAPKTKFQKFVHLCDYLASRKLLEVNFNVIPK